MNCIPMLLNTTSSWFWPWTKMSSVASNDWLTNWNKFIMWCKETSKKNLLILFLVFHDVCHHITAVCWQLKKNQEIIHLVLRDAIKKNNDMIFVWLGDEQWWIFFQCQVKKWCIQNNINGIFFFIIITYTRIFLIQIIFVIRKKRRYYHSIKKQKRNYVTNQCYANCCKC